MHGLIPVELQRFADVRFGKAAWPELVRDAGLEQRMYLAADTYPDVEVAALITATARRAGIAVPLVLKELGEFLVPTLMKVYQPYIKPDWKTLDMIEHTEANIHRAVRLRSPGAAPPELKARRVSPTEVVVIYESERKMCGLAKGIIRGVAKHYGERVEVTELTCMLKGKSSCTIAVQLR